MSSKNTKTNETSVVTNEVTNNVITSEVITPMELTVVAKDTTTTKRVKDINNISYNYTIRLSDTLSVMRALLFINGGGKSTVVLNNNAFNVRYFTIEIVNNVVVLNNMVVIKDGRTGNDREQFERIELALSIKDFMSLKTLNVNSNVEVVNGEVVSVACEPVVTLYDNDKTSIQADKIVKNNNDQYVMFWNALLNK